jgi:hypothetical protein
MVVATVSGMVAAGGMVAAHNNPSAGHVRFAHKAGQANKVKGMQVLPLRKVSVSATDPSEDTARANATRVRIFAQGPLEVYAKCYRSTSDPANPGTHGEVYIRTSVGGTVFDGDSGDSSNGFIGPSTPESERRLVSQSSFAGVGNPGTLNIIDAYKGAFYAAAGNRHLTGQLLLGTKVGTPPAGNGLFGAGDRCLFGGVVHWR